MLHVALTSTPDEAINICGYLSAWAMTFVLDPVPLTTTLTEAQLVMQQDHLSVFEIVARKMQWVEVLSCW